MLESKMFELRDSATFIPILCIKMGKTPTMNAAEQYLLNRCGYGKTPPFSIIMVDAYRGNKSSNDAYGWPSTSRTYQVAHHYIEENWNILEPGQVIDVEFILGETTKPKQSEAITAKY